MDNRLNIVGQRFGFCQELAGVLAINLRLLHLNGFAGELWKLLVILFTATVLVIHTGGAVWIRVNLHSTM